MFVEQFLDSLQNFILQKAKGLGPCLDPAGRAICSWRPCEKQIALHIEPLSSVRRKGSYVSNVHLDCFDSPSQTVCSISFTARFIRIHLGHNAVAS
jgi:hypothetical protein